MKFFAKWKAVLDNKYFEGILMDLLRAFDTINHGLLIAKLHAYGFHKSPLKILWSYLTNRWQRANINTAFSSWTEIMKGVPQGSVLGPILFYLILNNLFFFLKEKGICSYVEDTSSYECNQILINSKGD